MTLISKTFTFTPGAAILSAEHNSNYNTIYDDYNGNITDINIKSDAAIADTKLAQITTANKISGSALNNALPIGSVYIAVVSTNPATLLGYGTWVAFGTGRTLVGIDTGDVDFDVVEETGGSKTHALITSEMPSHTHSINMSTNSNGGTTGYAVNSQLISGATTPSTSATGSGTAHTIVQPYIVVFMWKRNS